MPILSFVRRGRLSLLAVAVAAVTGLAFLPGVVASATPTAASAGGKPTIILEHGASAYAVPSPGGVDLYIKSDPDPPFPGLAECFANGVPAREAAVVAAVQRPIALHALVEPSGVPAWRTIPSWALVGTDDRVITPAEQEFMATRANAHTVKVDAGHLSLITRPDAVTDLIVTAVNATS